MDCHSISLFFSYSNFEGEGMTKQETSCLAEDSAFPYPFSRRDHPALKGDLRVFFVRPCGDRRYKSALCGRALNDGESGVLHRGDKIRRNIDRAVCIHGNLASVWKKSFLCA